MVERVNNSYLSCNGDVGYGEILSYIVDDDLPFLSGTGGGGPSGVGYFSGIFASVFSSGLLRLPILS